MTSLSPDHGPLLLGLLEAQKESDAATAYPTIRRWADALVKLSAALEHPVLLPVTAAAERLVGAAVVVGRGRLRVCTLSDTLEDERILLVDVAAVSGVHMLQSAEHARRLGAAEILGCAVRLHSGDGIDGLDGYFDLAREPSSGHLATAA
jgi:hypothetical protein